MTERRDAWLYSIMTMEELIQRRDALISLVRGTTGRKQRRYIKELDYCQSCIDDWAVQMVLFDDIG